MIHFTSENWARTRETYDAWWEGALDRPLIKSVVRCFDPGRPAPKAPFLSQENCHDFSYSPEEIVDAMDYELSQLAFMGDAFPIVNFDSFGPGVLAAFCGAKLDNQSGRVWFFPAKKLPIDKIHIHYDPENPWVQRIKAIYRAGLDRWEGNVLMGMPDLGGVMDVVATFRGSEELLMDLYDAPEEVHRLRQEAYAAWMEAYEDLSKVLAGNPGHSDWDGLYSSKPSYVLQSDFCYMIGTPMFDEFVLPDIENACRELGRAIYHLDGIGELKHLDHLLEIPELNAVQWVYGDGQPSARHWIDVYQKIAAAGKGIHMIGGREDFEAIRQAVPNGRFYAIFAEQTVAETKAMLEHFGVPANKPE